MLLYEERRLCHDQVHKNDFLVFGQPFCLLWHFSFDKKIKDHSPTIIEYPLLNNGYDLSDPYTALIYYYLPESDEMVTCDTEMEREGDFLDALLSQWRNHSHLPAGISFEFSETKLKNEDNLIYSGSSTYIEHVSSPYVISLEISSEIYQYTSFEGPVLDSLVQTIRTAYFDDCILTIIVGGQVVYRD